MSQTSYIWAVGYHNDGSPSICGPYLDEHEAGQKTDHLSRVSFTRLATRSRSAAIPQLSDRLKSGSQQQRHREPVVGSGRIISRIFRRKPKKTGTEGCASKDGQGDDAADTA